MSSTSWSSRRTSRCLVVAAVIAAACDSTPSSESLLDTDPTSSSEKFPALPPTAPDMASGPPKMTPARPDFGSTVSQTPAPPALGGASLVLSDDGNTAIATDPDRDRVVVVDLVTKLVRPIALHAGDEPGRLVVDTASRVHVVLDRAGAIATIDVTAATVLQRRSVCPAPQGIAREGATLFVACTGGEIVSLSTDPAGPAPKLLARVDRDLRDIVVAGESLLVSRLRTAEVLRIRKSDGAVVSRAVRPGSGPPVDRLEPFVAWRMIPSGSGGAVAVHQMARASKVDVDAPEAYGSADPCGGTVVSTVTTFKPEGSSNELVALPGSHLGQAVVPIDIARSPTGQHWAVIAAGNGHTKSLPQVHLVSPLDPVGSCRTQPSTLPMLEGGHQRVGLGPDGQAVAVVFRPDSSLVVFTREPATLQLLPVADLHDMRKTWEKISLGGESQEDTGHAIFHSNTGGNVACVSCHPGGGDDGRVWSLSTGARRTQSLQGTLEGTAPYHWGGDAPGIETFAKDVFAARMGGQALDGQQVEALASWIIRIPAPVVSPPLDTDALTRGKALFESAAVGCTGCHSGAKLTNSESVDVGTGGTFQVPSLLGLALRAPYLHDGRAATLLDRFGAQGGGNEHGQTQDLTTAQVKDLVTYLESL